MTTDDFDPDRLKLGAPAAITPEVSDEAVPEQKVELTVLGARPEKATPRLPPEQGPSRRSLMASGRRFRWRRARGGGTIRRIATPRGDGEP